jgi:hypothetical protein
MKKGYLACIVVLSVLIGSIQIAGAATINFSGLASDGPGYNNYGFSLTYSGFKFTSTPDVYGDGVVGLVVWQNQNVDHPIGGASATSLLEYFAYATTTMTEAGNKAFNVNAIDLAPYRFDQHNGTPTPFDVTFYGTKSNNSIVQQTFTVNNNSGSPVLQHFVFNGFTDIMSLSFTQGVSPGSPYSAYQFNNIAVAPVPIPPSAWFLGSGILGLIGIRRRFRK